MPVKHTDKRWSLSGRVVNRVYRRSAGSGDYLEGCVLTPRGIVHATAQGGGGYAPRTFLTYIDYAGRVRARTIFKRLTAAGIARAARQFTKEACC